MTEKPSRKEIEDQLRAELEEAESEMQFWTQKALELRDAVYGISHPGSFEESSSERVIKDVALRIQERKQS